MKYTALEIVTKTGVENPASLFGNVAIEIGGIGVNTPDHIIDTQDAEEVAVVIGTDEHVAPLPEEDALEMSDAVKEKVAADEAATIAAEAEPEPQPEAQPE